MIKILMTVHHLLVEQVFVLIKSTTSLVIVLDLGTPEQLVTLTLMNVKLKNLVILMLLVLTTKAHTSVTVNQDLTERTVTKILMTVEATHVKMEVCLFYITTNEAKMNDIQYRYLETKHLYCYLFVGFRIFNIIVEYFIMPSLRSAEKIICCLLHKMFLIREFTPSLNMQLDSY